MHAYGVREVEKLLHLPRSTIRALIKAGFVTPARGPRNSWLFSFQDLLVLRTARALLAARVPHRRITRAIRELRRQAASGQLPLAFGADAPAPALVERWESAESPNRGYELHEAGRLEEAEAAYRGALAAGGPDPLLYFNLGVVLEDLKRRDEAVQAYREALRLDPQLADCHYNLALLYEKLKKPRDAIRHMAAYRRLAKE